MAVLKREKVIQLLKRGELLTETQWAGYQYNISFSGTVRYETARWLINRGLVKPTSQGKSPLVRSFKWVGKEIK